MPSQRPGISSPKGKKNKGKSRAPPPPAGPKRLVTPKRRRRKPKLEKGDTGDGEVVDLTLEEGDLVEVDDGLDTPEPGGSRGATRTRAESSNTRSGEYAPTAFTPLSRSILSGMARVTPDEVETDTAPAPPTSSPEHDAAAPAPTEPHHTADIVIEEIPRSPASPSTKLDRPSAGTDHDHDHFDPPGLFSTSLMPTLVPLGSKSPHVELRPSEETVETSRGKDGAGSNDEEKGLLLPSHVMLDTVAAVDEADEEERPVGDSSMEGLHFVDDDVAKGVTRYFDDSAGGIDETSFLATADQSKICSNCKKPGHKPRDCPHIICTTCGVMDQHERRDCPFGLVCFACGQRGHRQAECPNPMSRLERRSGCARCGSREHKDISCPSLWRVYTYFSTESRAEAIRAKSALASWEKEAACGGASEQWCYNCARQGHLGDDCPSRRGSLARLMTPSAFSEQMSSRGPFRGKIPGSGKDKLVEGVASHMRFDEDVDLEGTIREWGGLGAGRKSREKEKRKLVERERRAAGSGDGGEERDWFDRPDQTASVGRGISIRGRGRATTTTTATGTPTGLPRRPWESERRGRGVGGRDRDRSASPPGNRSNPNPNPNPFGHGHLMSSHPNGASSAPASPKGKGIVFGKLSLPGGSRGGSADRFGSPAGTGSVDSPTVSRGQVASRGKGAKTLVSRALGLGLGSDRNTTPTSSPSPGVGSGSPRGSASANPSPSPLASRLGSRESTPTSSSTNAKGNQGGRKRRRKDPEESGTDWEANWRAEGKLGGNVAAWGSEMDQEERKAKKSFEREKGGGKGRGAASPAQVTAQGTQQKGNKGQRYHGGY